MQGVTARYVTARQNRKHADLFFYAYKGGQLNYIQQPTAAFPA